MTHWQNRIIGEGIEAPDQLLANPANWRIHPKPQQDALTSVLDTVGWVQRVIVNKRTGHIVDGHLRVEMAISRNEPGVPVVYVDLSEDEERTILATIDPLSAMAATDAAQLADLLASIETEDAAVRALLEQIGQERGVSIAPEPQDAPEAQIDRAEELREKWGVEYGDLWVIPSKHGGEHRILCGDSTKAEDVARVMGDKRAEMVWTDPPYGVAIGDKNKFLNAIARSNRVEENLQNDNIDESSLTAMIDAAFDAAAAHCENGGAWYVAAPPGPLHVIWGTKLKSMGIWRQTIQWVKNNATFSPLGVDYHWRAEPIFYGWMPNGAHRYYGGRQQDTVWEIDRPLKSPEHPTMKPVELVCRAISNSSKHTELVLDPFCGSGTTLVACEQTGRQGRAIDIEPKYVAVALERLSLMGLTPKRVETGGG